MIIKRRFIFDYLWIIAGGLLVFSLAGLFFYFGTGDFFFNFKKLVDQAVESKGSIERSVQGKILAFEFSKNLFLDLLFRPFNLMLLSSLLVSLISYTRKLRFILIWFFVLLFYLDILAPFHGLKYHDRYLSVIIVPSVLLISSTIFLVLQNYRYKVLAIILILIMVTSSAKAAVEFYRPQTVLHPHFLTYKALANRLKNEKINKIYVNNLADKGYIFNYMLDFDSLNYNSFQREKVEGTDSLMVDWDGLKTPEKGSFVVVDSEGLYKKVKPNWKLISKKLKASLYFVE